MTTLIDEPLIIPTIETEAAPSACRPWCLGPTTHEDGGCVSAAVELASGLTAWLSATPCGAPHVVTCGLAPELDADAVGRLVSRLAGLWAKML
jgi:hypothetical protein